jgi:RNA polymerase sigma factor (TIGR02999 family)
MTFSEQIRSMEPDPTTSQITRLLRSMSSQTGAEKKAAYDELVTLLYVELKRYARRQLRGERADSLHPTRLVHELYDRMLSYSMPYQDRDHFLNVAASAMRRILIDRARRMSAERRGGREVAAPLDEELDVAFGTDPDLLIAVDEAMAVLRPEQVQLVELRFFAGYTMEETAQLMGVKIDALKKRWQVTKLVLYEQLSSRAR